MVKDGGLEQMVKMYEKGVVVGDFQYPFENKKAVKLFNNFLKDFHPDALFVNGDLVDFYEISKFDKNPKRKHKLQDEIDAGVKELRYMRDVLPNAYMVFLEGNHEERNRKFLWRNPSIASLRSLDLKSLLCLEELKIKYVPYKKPFMHRGLYINHGDIIRKYSGVTAKAELDELATSGIIGHTHRLGAYYKTTIGKEMSFYESGSMCKLSQEYAMNPNWQNGFVVIYFDKKGRNHSIQPVHIKGNRFIFNGKVYK